MLYTHVIKSFFFLKSKHIIKLLSQTRKTRPELFNESRKFRKYGIKLKKELHKTNLVNHQKTLTNTHLSRNNLLQNLC